MSIKLFFRFLLTKSCRRASILRYFGEEVDDGATCESLGGAPCDNCQSEQTTCDGNPEFNIIADAINELLNHGITKV